MADEQDDSQKTEEPSQKRLDDAREKGQISTSREVSNFMLLGTAALLAATMAGPAMSGLAGVLRPFLARPHAMAADPVALGRLMLDAITGSLLYAGVPLLGFVVAAIAAAAVQNGIVWTTEPLTPKGERISPLAGAKRLFSLKSMVEFLKNLFKISLIAAIGIAVLWPERGRILAAGQLSTAMMTTYMGELTNWLLAALASALALLAGLDFAYQRFEFMKQMRMSRQDLKDEHKQSEGDPIIKQRLRAMRMERARQRMMSDVPKATVIVTNPTHVSVALQYDMDSMQAPRVVAKGVDHLALKIREVAKAHGVPLMESPPLARALNATVGIGETVPPAHYKAVAEIIGHVMRMRQGR